MPKTTNPFIPISNRMLYVQDEELVDECATCGRLARRLDTRSGEFFCSDRCVAIGRPATAA